MTVDVFNKEVEAILNKIKSVLLKKTGEYGDSDTLECFKHAANIAKTSPVKALYGFWLKHITSIADMVSSGKKYELSQWEEKVIDNINYSILLLLQLREEN